MDSDLVAILFDRFGPYHCARLRAASRRMNILALELCGQSRQHPWDSVETGQTFPRITLFPDRDSETLSAEECRRRILAVLDAHRPPVVAVPGWSSFAALAALFWCGQSNRPAVIMSESTVQDKPRTFVKEMIKRRIVRHCGAAGLVGGGLHADYLIRLGMPPDRVFRGYDAVDNDHFIARARLVRERASDWRASLELPDRYLLACCRFVPEKNLLRLMQSYAAYRNEVGSGYAVPLVILGDGPLRKQILRERAALGLEGSVPLPGFKQYEELPAYYALADGFIQASISEPWGLVVNEALACGLPVLVSNRCGCASELVSEGENGWTFDPSDTAAITAVLRRLTALSPKEREKMGQRGKERIARWSPEAFGDGLQRAVRSARQVPRCKFGWLDRWLFLTMASRS